MNPLIMFIFARFIRILKKWIEDTFSNAAPNIQINGRDYDLAIKEDTG